MEFHFCPNCGAKLQYAEAEICPSCGVRIRQPPTPPAEIYAGFRARLAAYLIDTVLLAVPSIIITLYLTMGPLSDALSGFSGLMSPLSGDMTSSMFTSPQSLSQFSQFTQMDPGTLFNSLIGSSFSSFGSVLWSIGEAFAIVLVIRWIYFAYLESSPRQATLGKLALGLVVVGKDNNRVSFARATGRWLGKLLSWATIGIGFSLIGYTEKRQGLHDLIAQTYVVRKNSLPAGSIRF